MCSVTLLIFLAAGEIVIFDRSWFSRASIDYVMELCTKQQYKRFLEIAPQFEKYVVDSGILLIKYWLEVGNKEQKRSFEARIDDRLRQWKLSAMDLPSRERWLPTTQKRVTRCLRRPTRICPLAYRSFRRQAASAPQCHFPFSRV